MPRLHRTLALITVLGSSPLLCSALARAASEAPTAALSSAPTRSDHTPPQSSALDIGRRPEPNTPITPMPMNLPDNATAEEIEGEYAVGVASLVLGTLFVSALMLGALYIVARQTWSAQH
jgi:hypothetical protein